MICSHIALCKKYIPLFNYIVRAMKLEKDKYRIYNIDHPEAIGSVHLHTQHLYVKIGNDLLHYIDEKKYKFLYRWCWDISDPTGGEEKYMLLRDLHDPDKVMRNFNNVIESKIYTM